MQPPIFQFQRCFGIPAIRPDEALSGWIISAAAAHRVSPVELLRAWRYPIRNAYEADFSRRIPPLSTMASLSLVSPTALARAHRASQTLLGDPRYACFSQRTDGSYIQRYCPRCLATEDVPYLKQKWRLDYQFLCEKHLCLLLDQCPSCGKLIDQLALSTRRARIGSQSLFSSCPYCRTALSKAARVLPPPALRGRLVTAQNAIHNLVVNAAFKHPYAGTVSSAKVLHSLMHDAGSDEVDAGHYVGLNFGRIFLNHSKDACDFLRRNRVRRR